MTALFVGASLGITGSLRKMTEQTPPSAIAPRTTLANRERKRPEENQGTSPVAYARGSLQQQHTR